MKKIFIIFLFMSSLVYGQREIRLDITILENNINIQSCDIISNQEVVTINLDSSYFTIDSILYEKVIKEDSIILSIEHKYKNKNNQCVKYQVPLKSFMFKDSLNINIITSDVRLNRNKFNFKKRRKYFAYIADKRWWHYGDLYFNKILLK